MFRLRQEVHPLHFFFLLLCLVVRAFPFGVFFYCFHSWLSFIIDCLQFGVLEFWYGIAIDVDGGGTVMSFRPLYSMFSRVYQILLLNACALHQICSGGLVCLSSRISVGGLPWKQFDI